MGAQRVQWTWIFASLLLVTSLFFLGWQDDRTEFVYLSSFYIAAFASYIVLIKSRSIRFRNLIITAILAQVVSCLFEPNLSIDYYRFLWDGELMWHGINPFDYTPDELAKNGFIDSSYLNEIYEGIGAQSGRNYSCYPPVNQFYFLLSTAFSNSVWVNAIVMKLLILLTEFAGAYFMMKLFDHFGIAKSRLWVLFLNPLWIIECTGNTHFEGVMISLLIIAFYYLLTQRLIVGALVFALAVQIKLVPLILLPFFFRYFGFKRSVLVYAIVLSLAFGLSFTLLNTENIDNFMQSLALYFQAFEFNSFLYYNILQIGKPFYGGYSPIRIVGPIISKISLGLVVLTALLKPIDFWKTLFTRMLFGYFIYLLLSSTLHPWYVFPLLFLSVFTDFSFPIAWSFLIFFSYFFYNVGNGSADSVRLMVSIEYAILFAYTIWELLRRGSPFKWLRVSDYFQPISVR